MGFLSPWFLAGIAAVGLPLWLHLLRQYTRTPRKFSSLMFFERRTQSSTKHRRLRYLTLLALRMALLVLLALAFANPFITHTTKTARRRTLTVIAIDRSFSMRYANRMAQAKADARRVLTSLHGRDLAQVIAVDSQVEDLTHPESDKSALLAAIDSLQPSDKASSFAEFVRALRIMEQTTGMRLDVHFISDMQKTSMPPNFADLRVGPQTTLALDCVGGGPSSNWAVEAVDSPAHVYDPSHTRLTATIAGWRTQNASRTVSLLLDGAKIASKQVEIPPNGRAQVQFLAFNVPYGDHRGEVQLEPHDSLPNDDSFPFAIDRSDPRKVLLLYANGEKRDAFYYQTAMDSAFDTGLMVQPAAIENALHIDLSKYAFIVLSDPGRLDPELERTIGQYVQRGGALLVALGPKSLRTGRVPVSGIQFSDDRQTQGVGFVDTGQRALQGTGKLENVQFSDTARLTPKSSTRILARLADGSPLLIEEPCGEGRILTFASGFDNLTNDFPVHASFVPFIAQTGRYLSGATDAMPSVVAGTPVELRRTRNESTAADVIAPDGKHQLSLSQATSALAFTLDRDGFYQIQRADGHRFLTAVHADRRESDLTSAPDETLALWRNTGSSVSLGEPGAVQQQTRPWSFWRYLLILALIASLIESVFASRYLKEGRQTA